jgi:hypothetical protein
MFIAIYVCYVILKTEIHKVWKGTPDFRPSPHIILSLMLPPPFSFNR